MRSGLDVTAFLIGLVGDASATQPGRHGSATPSPACLRRITSCPSSGQRRNGRSRFSVRTYSRRLRIGLTEPDLPSSKPLQETSVRLRVQLTRPYHSRLV